VVDAFSGVDVLAPCQWNIRPFVLDILSSPEEGLSPVMFCENERTTRINRI
jgi:hypothetical protein